MEAIGCLHNLQTLVLGKARISDQGLMHLSKLTKLVELNLFQTAVTSMAPFESFRCLRVLDLAHTRIENNGLKSLSDVVSE